MVGAEIFRSGGGGETSALMDGGPMKRGGTLRRRCGFSTRRMRAGEAVTMARVWRSGMTVPLGFFRCGAVWNPSLRASASEEETVGGVERPVDRLYPTARQFILHPVRTRRTEYGKAHRRYSHHLAGSRTGRIHVRRNRKEIPGIHGKPDPALLPGEHWKTASRAHPGIRPLAGTERLVAGREITPRGDLQETSPRCPGGLGRRSGEIQA